jgi:hypothetical protein
MDLLTGVETKTEVDLLSQLNSNTNDLFANLSLQPHTTNQN